jgi:acyl carrier protein
MTMTVDQKGVADAIAEWTVANFGIGQPASALPRDESLVELGYLDSYAVVELVEFLEKNWNISILNEEITREKMGSLNKMATLILQKRGVA